MTVAPLSHPLVRVLHCAVGRDGSPLFVSDTWRRFAAVEPARVRERGWRALVHPDDVDALLAAWRGGVESAAAFAVDLRCRGAEGEFHQGTLTATPLFDGEGIVAQWLAAIEVQGAGAHTGEQDALVTMRRQRLMATMAHELRDPLQAMRQATYVLQLPNISESAREQMLEVLERQLTRLSGVSDSVLELTSLSWNAIRLSRQAAPLEQVVVLATAEADEILRERSQRLEVSMSDPHCELVVDSQRLAHALAHLLDNAARHSDPGRRVALDARCQGEEVVFTVDDEGAGISAEALPRIFDMFRRDTSPNDRAPRRLGVGLALARHVALLHGGALVAESDGPGRGSRFQLRIPRRAPNE